MLIPIIRATGITRDALSIVLADQTGSYNLTTNLGGYGAPNAAIPPAAVGFRFRNWNQTTDYYNAVSNDTTLITELLASGHKFDSTILGLSPYRAGVHQIKYYPFETVNTLVNLTQGSKIVTWVSGIAPNTFNAAYKAVIFLDATTAIVSKVVMLDTTIATTATTFAVTDAWTLPSAVNYSIKLATEADLKVIFPQLADKCINVQIGNLSQQKQCDTGIIDTLTRLLLWKFSAQVKFDCKDYTGADNLLSAAYDECNICPGNDCKTC